MSKLNQAADFASGLRTKSAPAAGPGDVRVDPHFEEDPRVSKLLEFAIQRRKHAMVVGPTGCGKSSLVINIGARLREQFEIFSCSGETSTDELIGKPWRVVRNGQAETVSVLGAALRAYRDGKILLLEEVDHANADILAALHRIMEKSQDFYVANIGEQEIIQKHRNFAVIATANTIGTGESTFIYAGTKPLNQAFMNRFNYTCLMDYLPADKEVKVLTAKTGVPTYTAEQMVKVANEARQKMSAMDSIVTPVSTRDLLEWADAVVGMQMTPIEAADFAFINRANESDKEALKLLVQNHCA